MFGAQGSFAGFERAQVKMFGFVIASLILIHDCQIVH
jgi:hypothetical protein